MKLKCRINEKDYDLVQGCTFTDNFNETLDSGIIYIDQIPEIIDLKPYTDVYIWNADEEFNGYYATGDYLFINCTISNKILSTGDVWTTWYRYRYETPYTEKPLFKYEINSETGVGTMSGQFWDIWFERFLCKNAEEANNLRFINGRGLGMNYDMILSIKNSRGDVSTNHILGFEVDKQFYDGTNIIRLVEKPGVEGSIPLLEPIICSYDIYNKTISFQSVQNAGLYLFETFTIIGISTWYDTYIQYKKNYQKQFNLVFDTDTFDNLDEFDIEVKYLNNWIKAIPSINIISEQNVELTLTVYPTPISHQNQHYDAIIPLTKVTDESGQISFQGTYVNNITDLVNRNPTFWGLVDDIRINSLSIIVQDYSPLPTFFKHLLVNNWNKTRLILNDSYNNKESLFKYEIHLFSETKRLEKIPLPNISITQSIVEEEKRSCWFYLEKMVDLYSPKYKKSTNIGRKTWKYISKYYVSRTDNNYLKQINAHIVTNLKDVFENVICPEFSLTNPSLKDVLSQIMIAKDLIPIVFNDVIYGLDIGAIDYQNFNRSGTNFDVSNMNSDNYATDARREYGNALSQENSAHLIEYMGFRNPDSTFLTLENMVLETRFPIYKINSIKMCYYKKFLVEDVQTSEIINSDDNNVFLCKYDMTPLVLQNVVRNTMSTNWESFQDGSGNVYYTNIAGDNYNERLANVAKYKLCTVGYDIGSNKITGWGATYEYLKVLWLKEGKSYIENIVNLLDALSGIGTNAFDSYLQNVPGVEPGKQYRVYTQGSGMDAIISFGDNNVPNKLKSIFFEIDYTAMYNGAIKHSKDFAQEDDIETVDNCSAALTVLEADGLFEKEKMNRMSNPVFQTPARYDNQNGGATIDRVQQLATYDELTDSIIYSREYQIFDNVILANYESTTEYVLKNYFTSVWAKYRTYSYMPYGESVKRAENFREFLLLSSNTQYYEKENLLSGNNNIVSQFLTFLKPTDINTSTGEITNVSHINCGYFVFNNQKYLSDVNSFASGLSVCFNIATYSNVSGGNYIESMSSNLQFKTGLTPEQMADYKTTQNWYNITSSQSDAFISEIGIYFGHLNEQGYWDNLITNSTVAQNNAQKFMALPLLLNTAESHLEYTFGNQFVLNKDNKENLDITFQFEYLVNEFNNENILFSPWVSKLNDMINVYTKFEKNEDVITSYNLIGNLNFYLYQNGDSKDLILKVSATDLNLIIDSLNENPGNVFFYDATIANGFSFRETTWSSDPLGRAVIYTRYAVSSSSNTFSINKCTSIENLASASDINLQSTINITFSFSKSVRHREDLILFGFPIAELANYTENLPSVLNNPLSLKYTGINETVDGEIYYYFKGNIANNPIFYGYRNPLLLVDRYFNTNYRGSANLLDLNENNSLYLNTHITAADFKTDETNMVLIVSTKKLKKNLVYNSFKVDSNNNCVLPEGMYFDTNGFNGVSNGHIISNIFYPSLNTIFVNASSYDNYAQNIKSIQYYYKDNNGWLHFVFGVNISRNDDYKYDNFNIFLSNVSKRNMKVYDDRHRVIGYNRNYQEILNGQQLYGEEQYYVFGKLNKPIISIPSQESINDFIINVNNSNYFACDLIILNNSIIIPQGDSKLIINPTTELSANEIDVTEILGTYLEQWLNNELDIDIDCFFADLNGNYTNSDNSIIFNASLNPISLRIVSNPTTTFNVGSTFIFDGQVMVEYSNGDSAIVDTSDLIITGYNMNNVGEQTVTISYTLNNITVTTEYDIMVNPLSVLAPIVSSISYSSTEESSWYFTVRNPNNFPCTLVIWYSSSEPIIFEMDALETLTINRDNADYLTYSITVYNLYYLGDDVYCNLEWTEDLMSNNVIILEANDNIIAPRVENVFYEKDPLDPYQRNVTYQFEIFNDNPYEVHVNFAKGVDHSDPIPEYSGGFNIPAHSSLTFGTNEINDLNIEDVFRIAAYSGPEPFLTWFELRVDNTIRKTSSDTFILR